MQMEDITMKYDKYIDEFMFSPEMKTYLKTVELSAQDILDLICLSPLPLKKKMDSLRILDKEASLEHNEELHNECDNQFRYYEKALSYIAEDGVFTAEPSWYNGSEREDSFDGVLATIDDVKDFIRNYIRLGELKDDALHWYDIRKWIKNDEGKYVDVCSYLFIRDEISFVDIDNYPVEDDDFSDLRSAAWGHDLNLPVPFKPGDVLQINGFPFGPKVNIVILEVGDNLDCCCLQALSKNDDGLWYTGAVKHNSIGFRGIFPWISPLYSATTLYEPAGENDRMLFRVQEFIGKEPEKGSRLWNTIYESELTDEELLDLLK